jgi:hypothetical protein
MSACTEIILSQILIGLTITLNKRLLKAVIASFSKKLLGFLRQPNLRASDRTSAIAIENFNLSTFPATACHSPRHQTEKYYIERALALPYVPRSFDSLLRANCSPALLELDLL